MLDSFNLNMSLAPVLFCLFKAGKIRPPKHQAKMDIIKHCDQ
jgi:hypothetical protein